MARSLYGGRLGDTVVSLFAIGDRQVLALPTDANGEPVWTVLEVYDAPDGTHLTDLLAANGTTAITSIAVPTDGQIPAFYGPDGYGDGLYLRDPEGDYYRLDAKGAAGPTGSTGPAGRSVSTVARTSGTGAAGTTDTYTITYSDATTSTFTVYNGANGAGTGDVVGPASAVADRIAVFNGTTGKLIKDGGVTVAQLQPLDADLTAIAALVSAANKMPYATGAGTWSLADLTAFARTLLDDADATAARATLGLGTAATVNTGTTSGTAPLLGASGTLAVARLATGTPDGTKFVRDDGTLAVPAGGSGSGLLATTPYNPASATNVTNATATFTDVDATNLTVTFTVPASGAVIVSLCAGAKTSASAPAMWGVGVGGTVVAASTAAVAASTTTARVTHRVKITGLTPAASVTYRWMHANASTNTTTTTYGGTGASATGQALMEVIAA